MCLHIHAHTYVLSVKVLRLYSHLHNDCLFFKHFLANILNYVYTNAENKDQTGAFWVRNSNWRFLYGDKKYCNYANESMHTLYTSIPHARTHTHAYANAHTLYVYVHTNTYIHTYIHTYMYVRFCIIRLYFHYIIRLYFHYIIRLYFHYIIRLYFHYIIRLYFHFDISKLPPQKT
jgi:hypothetical protein